MSRRDAAYELLPYSNILERHYLRSTGKGREKHTAQVSKQTFVAALLLITIWAAGMQRIEITNFNISGNNWISARFQQKLKTD